MSLSSAVCTQPCVQYVVKKLKQQGVGRGNLSATGDVKGAARENTKPTTS